MSEYKSIISEIECFKQKVHVYFKYRFANNSRVSDEDLRTAREYITKNSPRIKGYLKNAGVPTHLVGRAAPAAGGFPFEMDLIDGMFQNEGHPYAVKPSMIEDALNKAIGIYESGPLPTQAPQKISKDSPFVDGGRIKELKGLKNSRFDLSKLIRILEEINIVFQDECYFAVASLVRMIIDHVPPIFDQSGFAQVVANYGGSRSFKESMKHLDESSRKIADQHLHTQIRPKEVLPNKTQVNFSHDVDVLLAEIVRILK